MRELDKCLQDVHNRLRSLGLKLAIAESCTGGMISDLLTDIPGTSDFLIADLVVYSVKAKRIFLEIPARIIREFGVVSKQTALQMAEGVREKTGADIGLSTTGNLGPSILEGKPDGLVYVGLSFRGRTTFRELHLKGERGEKKRLATLEALRMLLDLLEELR